MYTGARCTCGCDRPEGDAPCALTHNRRRRCARICPAQADSFAVTHAYDVRALLFEASHEAATDGSPTQAVRAARGAPACCARA